MTRTHPRQLMCMSDGGKIPILGSAFEGPFEIMDRIGKSVIKIRVGSYANGEPRYEQQHWHNCKPAVMAKSTTVAERKALGRKKLNPEASNFIPSATFIASAA